ncbi:hypothetical protein ACH5RR_001293, partial [Cinchona calisaya]
MQKQVMVPHEETHRELETVIQESLAQLAQHPQPPPARHEKGLEDNFVALSKIGVPFFERHVDQGKADKWFREIEKILELLKAFPKYYFLPTLIAQKRREFTMLKQKPGMSVAMYSHQFPVLGHYAPIIINDPAAKMIYFFLDGLLSEIQTQIATSRIRTFDRLCEAACDVELDMKCLSSIGTDKIRPIVPLAQSVMPAAGPCVRPTTPL